MEISFGGRRIRMEQNVRQVNEKLLLVPWKRNGYELMYSYRSGGSVWRHELVDEEGIDYDDLLEISIDKAEIGCVVHILPTLAEDHPLRASVFAGAKERKCPDLKIDGVYTEVKVPVGILHERKINNNIKEAYAQANEIIIKLRSNFDLLTIRRIVKGRFITHQNLNVIEFKVDEIYHLFKRSDFV